MTTIYGIKNCDTMKKARKWLDDQGVDYTFHDYKKDGISVALLDRWIKEVGHEALLNTRGTTWRKLSDAAKKNVTAASAKRLMLENPSIIKRPVLDTGKTRVIGFEPAIYGSLFKPVFK